MRHLNKPNDSNCTRAGKVLGFGVCMVAVIAVVVFFASIVKGDDGELRTSVCHRDAEADGLQSRGVFVSCSVDDETGEIVELSGTNRLSNVDHPDYERWTYIEASDGVCKGIDPREIFDSDNRNVLYTAAEISRAYACLPLQKAGVLR